MIQLVDASQYTVEINQFWEKQHFWSELSKCLYHISTN